MSIYTVQLRYKLNSTEKSAWTYNLTMLKN